MSGTLFEHAHTNTFEYSNIETELSIGGRSNYDKNVRDYLTR